MYRLWKFQSRKILTAGCILLHCVANGERIREGCEINDDNRNGRIQRRDESSQSSRFQTTKYKRRNTEYKTQKSNT